MDSTLVIKVKYGDGLRRFSAAVDENNRLDLDMVGLRAKISSIFNLSADANLILRYVDEDGDLVTLVDDDDLGDVMRQQLKFLKIDVHVSNDIGGKANTGSSGSATPLKSPQVTNPLQGRDVLIMNSLPEHVCQALSEFSLLRDALSSPAVANVADLPSKIRLSQPKDAAGTRSRTGAPEGSNNSEAKGPRSPDVNSASNASVHGDSEVPLTSSGPNPSLGGNSVISDISSSVPEHVQEFFKKLSSLKDASSSPVLADLISLVGQSVINSLCQNATSDLSSNNGAHEKPTTSQSPNVNLADLISQVGQSVLSSLGQPKVTAGPSSKKGIAEKPTTSEARGAQSPPRIDIVSDASHPVVAGNAIRAAVSASDASRQVEVENVIGGVTTATGAAPVYLNFLPLDPYTSQSKNDGNSTPSSAVSCGERNKGKMSATDGFHGKGDDSGASSSPACPNNSSTQTPALSSGLLECPFSGGYIINPRTPPRGNIRIPPFKRSYNQSDAITGMFHKGVRCDGCGVYPITGPRFKSKVKENYDLCNICFNEMGNEADYIRMDRPASVRTPRFAYEHALNIPTLPAYVSKRGGILKHAKPKLDSRFILDVNIIDGTMMAPSTPFTKIWRMHNNGTLVWPQGTQLVWIGGDKFSDSHSVGLEVSKVGVPVEMELDIAVDFTAPQSPGRYISYWRMASPSGQKFGQRVWVLIQVDDSLKDSFLQDDDCLKDSFYDSAQGLNLNIPLDVSCSKGPQLIDINVQPIEDGTSLQAHDSNALVEPVNQMADREGRLELENELHINEATVASAVASAPASAPAAPSPVSYPIIDFSGTAPAAPSPVSYPIIDFSGTAPAVPPSNLQSSTGDVSSSSLGIGGINSVEEKLLQELEEMGFKQVDLNKEILRMNEYDLEQSVDDLCGVCEWDPILEELQEMGFRDNETNKRLLKKNNGSIKRVVMDLINGEED